MSEPQPTEGTLAAYFRGKWIPVPTMAYDVTLGLLNKIDAERTLRLQAEQKLQVAVEALKGFTELQPRPEEYINQSEWRKGAMDMAEGVAKTAMDALKRVGGEKV